MQIFSLLITEIIPQWLTVLDDFKWPVFAFAVILLFFRTIQRFLSRLNKGKLLGAELELSDNNPQTKQQESVNKKGFTTLEKSIAFFDEATVNMFRGYVETESEINNVDSNEDKIENLIKYASVVFIKYRFDEIYERILGSQLKILLHLNTVIGIGETFESLKPYYDKAVEEYAVAYENYSYNDYFQFLINRHLIIREGDRYIITILGVDFVKYIPETKKNYNKPF